ncbi:MAG: hypothetical protein ACJ8FM_19390 [Xanthobacteraceae bacterium]
MPIQLFELHSAKSDHLACYLKVVETSLSGNPSVDRFDHELRRKEGDRY